ncbi:type III restriction-modification system endonuclease [Paenibacillus sp. WLX2291]|uniref:type III restriction-modification system endonuclease n=1 Tax=Paenibacillus sp. WLX2291 TaxID=3296934 RepID=UPI003983DF6C
MNIQFKHQSFQWKAVQSVVDCFKGQPNHSSWFRMNQGKRQLEYAAANSSIALMEMSKGFQNSPILLPEMEVLDNIQDVQRNNKLQLSNQLAGNYNLTVEMETGTGKTYTYIRTMFELYRTYGWSKFIVVVPSIAIREGVLKTLQITEQHFMSEYGMKARYFVYNSKQLHHIDQFASDAGLNIMIINSQAFAARGKDARRIYMELDDFHTRRPIDIIAETNPILIIDEPQSVEGKTGKATREGIQQFNALFTLRYSATHLEDYNKVYRLDALDAYNMKLVKKIQVKGISVHNTGGMDSYVYLEGIDVSTDKSPIARLEYEVLTKSGIVRKTRNIHTNDNLYHLSGELEQYKGYVVSDINGQHNTIHFINGKSLQAGEVRGDINELQFRRIQIRETIRSHFEKERLLYYMGIKVLSLFFIDEVARYRQYDQHNHEQNGIYAQIFEEEYMQLLHEQTTLVGDEEYLRYLSGISASQTHTGYFSIDRKSKRLIDSKSSNKSADSDDLEAYDLIMKEKEKLLSFSEKTRFIFSHSALKEGWDNPNVFQICTLKHSDSTIKKRQEVGRGLRLCVNQNGERMDSGIPNIDVHRINMLTVIASESYEQFAQQLQREIADELIHRPQKADREFFLNKILKNSEGTSLVLDEVIVSALIYSLINNQYIDREYRLTERYQLAAEQQQLVLPDELQNHVSEMQDLLQMIYTVGQENMASNGRNVNIPHVHVNDNFNRKEFREFWNRINRKTIYTVRFDSDELIRQCIHAIDQELYVPELRYSTTKAVMNRIESTQQLQMNAAFTIQERTSEQVQSKVEHRVKYDLIGKLMDQTHLTRKTIVSILTRIRLDQFELFDKNPEEFIIRVARLINDKKAARIIESVTYDVLNERFESEIFTMNTLNGQLGENAIPANKHIYDYVITDSIVERRFAKELDVSHEVQVFAKLPKGFYIPTPLGQYNPDWAIVFKEGTVKHIYFIAETKGTMNSMELRGVENAKIACARKHFEKISTEKLKYEVVHTYEELLNIVKS